MVSYIWMGWITRESGKDGYACMGDRGRAYGAYQLDYRYALPEFLSEASRDFPDLSPWAGIPKGDSRLVGNADLHKVWKRLAETEAFRAAQDDFARRAYYEPAAARLLALGVNPDHHSAAFRGSLFSMAIRSGTISGADRMAKAGTGTEEGRLRAAYATYGQEDAGRWPAQLADALKAMGDEEAQMVHPGSKGDAVMAWQETLLDLGAVDCSEYWPESGFVDGAFGARTRAATIALQAAWGYPQTGVVTAALARKAEEAVSAETRRPTTDEILAAASKLTAAYKGRGFSYGSPQVAPWLAAQGRSICCDRFVDDVLWRCGFPLIGNRDNKALPAYFRALGLPEVEESEVKAGDVVFVNGGSHVFICAGEGLRYDCGSESRIRAAQPFSEPIVGFFTAFRPTKVEGIRLDPVFRGSRGGAVMVLQAALKWHGYYSGRMDGDFGPATEKALVGFQSAEGIAADGACGSDTWGRLLYNGRR